MWPFYVKYVYFLFNIQGVIYLISKNLNVLLAGEARVELNGEKQSLDSTLEQRYLEESRTLLLEAGNNVSNSEPKDPINDDSE